MALGAVEKNVLDRLGRKDVTEVTAEDIATLIGLGTSVKEGDITIEDAFPETMVQPKTPKQETIPAKTMPGRKPTQRGGKKNKKVEKPEPDPEAERQEAEDKMLAATQAKIDKEIADIESGNVFQSE